jgi:hypothetical protein
MIFVFGGGFFFGAYPERNFFKSIEHLNLTHSSDFEIPPEALIYLFEKYKIEVRLNAVDLTTTAAIDPTSNKQVYLLWASQIEKDNESASLESLKGRLAVEFKTQRILEQPGLPIGWRSRPEEKVIELLYLLSSPSLKNFKIFEEAFLDPLFLEILLKHNQTNSTLDIQYPDKVSSELSAQHMRDYPLSDWQIRISR